MSTSSVELRGDKNIQQQWPTAISDDERSETTPSEPLNIPDSHPEQPKYIKRSLDWFREGRILCIHAPDDNDLDGRSFIILDKFEEYAQGVRLEVYQSPSDIEELLNTSEKGLTALLLTHRKDDSDDYKPEVCHATAGKESTSAQSAKLPNEHTQTEENDADSDDEYYRIFGEPGLKDWVTKLENDDELHKIYHAYGIPYRSQPGSVVRLEYTTNLSYHHAYADIGMLDEGSLEELYFAYVNHLIFRWRIGRSKARLVNATFLPLRDFLEQE